MNAIRVSIDTTRCQGHGRCAVIAPDVFDVDDLGQGKVLLDPCPEKFRSVAEEAEFTCPEAAIIVSSLSHVIPHDCSLRPRADLACGRALAKGAR